MSRPRGSGLSLLFLYLLTFLSCASFATASGECYPCIPNPVQDPCYAPASFCKCTCFSNSTIIPLGPGQDQSDSFSSNALHLARDFADTILDKRANSYQALSCNDCNRKFCLSYDLPTCKGAKEEDVVSTCFQRDSRKDEAIVFIFIFATSGLLAWALCGPWVEKWMEAVRERRRYIPVSGSEGR